MLTSRANKIGKAVGYQGMQGWQMVCDSCPIPGRGREVANDPGRVKVHSHGREPVE